MPLPIAVLTGFLGSGKTTFLRRILTNPEFSDTAVIVNEFGEVALDHLLLATGGETIAVLPNGCLCCAVQQGLVNTLHDLLRQRGAGTVPPFRRMVIETSGLAEPAPILYTIASDPGLEAALTLDGVVTTVDSVAGLATIDRFGEATAQVILADRLLLTKTDLAPPSQALLGRLTALNPGAIRTPAADATGDALFGHAHPVPPSRFWAAAAHTHGIQSFVLRLRTPMTRLEFAKALGGLARTHGDRLLRVKGLVAFADRAGGPAVIHAVQHTMYPPRWLETWPQTEQSSRLVFIVRALDPEDVLRGFSAGDPLLEY